MEDEGLNQVDEENIIPLTDEFGNTVNFEFLDLIEYESEQYVVLLPIDDNNENNPEDDSVVVILKLDDSDTEDEEVYSAVEDESVIQAVFEIFKDKFKDEYSFTEGEEDDGTVNLTNPDTFADMNDIYNDNNDQ